jgi:sugar lactone lactonase YvrE
VTGDSGGRATTPAWEHAEDADWACVLDARARLGEIPVYAPDQHALYWMDLLEPALHRLDLATKHTTTWPLLDTGGCYALYEDRKHAIVAISSGIYRLSFDSGQFTLLHEAPYDRADFRFNDGKCDPRGRFWVGSIVLAAGNAAEGSASFWCIDQGELRHGFDGITVANGVGFSPSGDTMYAADRPGWRILAFDYDVRSGQVANPRTFARVPEGHVPDGAAIDVEGNYWIALFRVGLIACFGTDGALRRVLRAPTSHPTMVTFGDRDMRTLFITTARDFLDADGLSQEPLAGGIFSLEIGVEGLPDHAYKP